MKRKKFIQRSSEVLPSDIRPSVVRPSDVRTRRDVRTSEVRPSNVRTSEVRLSNVRTSDVRTSDVRTSDIRSSEFLPSDIRPSNVRTSNVRTSDFRTSDVRTSDVRTSDVRTSLVIFVQVISGELPVGAIVGEEYANPPLSASRRSYSARFPACFWPCCTGLAPGSGSVPRCLVHFPSVPRCLVDLEIAGEGGCADRAVRGPRRQHAGSGQETGQVPVAGRKQVKCLMRTW